MRPSIILQGIALDEFLLQIETIIDKKVQEAVDRLQKPNSYKFMNAKEVSAWLQISTVTLHNWAKAGNIKQHRVGSKVLYRSDEVEAALAGKKFKRRW